MPRLERLGQFRHQIAAAQLPLSQIHQFMPLWQAATRQRIMLINKGSLLITQGMHGIRACLQQMADKHARIHRIQRARRIDIDRPGVLHGDPGANERKARFLIGRRLMPIGNLTERPLVKESLKQMHLSLQCWA